MSIAKWIAAGCVAFAMGTGAAFAADDCTDDALQKKQEEFGAYLQANPEKAEKVETAVSTVEQKYGGEPPREKQCNAIDELMEELKKL